MEEIREIKKLHHDTRKEMITLKVKVATFASIFGVLGGYLKTAIGKLL